MTTPDTDLVLGVDVERASCPSCGDPACTFPPACQDALGTWPERSYPHHDRDPDCETCADTGWWTTTLEEAPRDLVNLGPCPDCDAGRYLVYVQACHDEACEAHTRHLWQVHGRPAGPLG